MNIFNKEGLKDLIANRYKGGEYNYKNRYFGFIEGIMDVVKECGGEVEDEVHVNSFDYEISFRLDDIWFVVSGSMYNGTIDQLYCEDMFSFEGKEREDFMKKLEEIANKI